MWKAPIKPGNEYAMREKRNAPVQHVRILEHVRGNRWKAEWIDPNPGLVHYVESGHLIAPWKQLKAFLREQEEVNRLREHNKQVGYDEESPVTKALYHVFESCGENQVSFYRGVLSGVADALERVKTRAGMAGMQNFAYAYTDRAGTIHLPFDEAVGIARRLCAAEPDTFLINVETTESKWSRDVRHGEDHLASLLNEFRASFALIRQWAGHDAAVAQREAENPAARVARVARDLRVRKPPRQGIKPTAEGYPAQVSNPSATHPSTATAALDGVCQRRRRGYRAFVPAWSVAACGRDYTDAGTARVTE
jgi:hypothetical protein